ncbi:MAG: hypothetical protein ACRDKE_00135, partial [Solirubrobacterales bacterium]
MNRCSDIRDIARVFPGSSDRGVAPAVLAFIVALVVLAAGPASAGAWEVPVAKDTCAYYSLRIATESIEANIYKAKQNRTDSKSKQRRYQQNIDRAIDYRSKYLKLFNKHCQPTVETLLAQAATDPAAVKVWAQLLALVQPGAGAAGPAGPAG